MRVNGQHSRFDEADLRTLVFGYGGDADQSHPVTA